MSEEVFPLVDKNGNIIGQATRSYCHGGSMLLHPVVHLHVFNTKGELYLQKRSSKKEIFPNLWDSSVGGHIDLGETPEIAVMREALEELGLTAFTPHFILKHIIETHFEKELTYCYYTISDRKLRPDKDEVSDGRFWTIDEVNDTLNKGIFTPNFETDFKLFLSLGVESLKV